MVGVLQRVPGVAIGSRGRVEVNAAYRFRSRHHGVCCSLPSRGASIPSKKSRKVQDRATSSLRTLSYGRVPEIPT